jgi:hypothetical protein
MRAPRPPFNFFECKTIVKEHLGDPDYGGFSNNNNNNNPIVPTPTKPKKLPLKPKTALAPSPSPSKAKKPIKHKLPPGLVVPVLPLVARMPKVIPKDEKERGLLLCAPVIGVFLLYGVSPFCLVIRMTPLSCLVISIALVSS